MVYLPEAMPASFQAIYTPVESAGTEAQIKHLARLMATQMTAAGLGPGECRAELTWAGVGTVGAGLSLLEELLGGGTNETHRRRQLYIVNKSHRTWSA